MGNPLWQRIASRVPIRRRWVVLLVVLMLYAIVHLQSQAQYGIDINHYDAVPEIALFAVIILVWAQRKPRALSTRCRACGYDLTGNLSGICPECGKAISYAVRRQLVGLQEDPDWPKLEEFEESEEQEPDESTEMP